MKFRGKIIKVILVDEAKEFFLKLKKTVNEEIEKRINSSTNQTLLNSIKNKITLLKENPEYGIHVPKNKIPDYYIKRYEISNLRKINLPNGWRIIHTIKGNNSELTVIILDIFSHKDYDRRFGYRQR